MRAEKPAPTEAAVQVTAVMSANNTHHELCIGQLVVWPKKNMAIFQSEPVLLHLGKQSGCKHGIKPGNFLSCNSKRDVPRSTIVNKY